MEEKNKKIEVIFPENSDVIIEEILKKHGLSDKNENLDTTSKSFSIENFFGTLDTLPGTKIAKLVKKRAEGEISKEDFPSYIENNLNIAKKDSEEIAEELEKQLLILVKPFEENELPTRRIPTQEIIEKITMSQKPTKKFDDPAKKDSYLETTE